MKSILGLVFACCLLAVAYSKGKPTLNPYPEVFTAIFNASNLGYRMPGQMSSFYLDLPNKRAKAVYPYLPGEYLLIFRPSGADPTSTYGQNYTQFVLNPGYPYNNTVKCYYEQVDDQGPWPDSWMYAANSQTFEEVGPFYELPNNLQYTGPYYVDELGIWTDRWDSTDICKLTTSGIGNVPCNSVMFTQGANPLPAMDIQAEAGHGFGSDSYYVRVYHTFKTSVSDADFAVPDQWQSRCGNGDAGFKVTPPYPFIMYSDGSADIQPTISLTSPPIEELGPVSVTVKTYPNGQFYCANCVTVDSTLTFTSDNWNVPQVVPLTYHNVGCSNMLVQAKGGGYNWTRKQSTLQIYTCTGTASHGCYTRPHC